MAEGGTKKVLVVDDEPDAIEFVTAVLEEAGYEVCSASDGVEGLAMARQERPDLVILDVQMPEKDGFATFADMRKDPELKSTPVIILTGVGERTGLRFSTAEMAEYLGEEPDAYVEKPVDPLTLQTAAQRLLGN